MGTMVQKYCVCLFLILPALSSAGPTSKFGSVIELCHRSSPDLAQCLTKAVNEALRKFADGHKPAGLLAFDPISVDVMDLGETKGSSLTLKQKFDNVKIFGLSKCDFPTTKAVFKDDECYWRIDGQCPEFRLQAHYKLEGKILIFPLNSQGPNNVTLGDVKVIYDMKCEKYTKGNKKYIRFTDFTMDVIPSKIHYNYLNLVPDNEEISNHMLEVFNENAFALYSDVKPNLNVALAAIFKHLMGGPLAKIPEDELFLD